MPSPREKYTHSPAGRLHAGVSGVPPPVAGGPTSRIDPAGSSTFTSRSSHPVWVGQLTATVDPSGLSAGRAMEAMLPSSSVRGPDPAGAPEASSSRTSTRSPPPPPLARYTRARAPGCGFSSIPLTSVTGLFSPLASSSAHRSMVPADADAK